MGNPLLLLTTRPWGRHGRHGQRRLAPTLPAAAPTTDAVFLVLRRMRAPLVVLIVIFAVSVAGLSMIEGVDAQGRPFQLTVFDAFYFMSYTATTIGFGELPNPFTAAQRLWVTLSIYSSVIGWAYAVGTLFALLQDQSFREAIATQRFRRRVRRLDEPFLILAGYGHAGRLVGQALDTAGRRFVVVDDARVRVEALEADQLAVDVPGIDADARDPAVLGLAGLGHPDCEGVLALTDDDEVNLAVVMAVHLLRPDLPVIARCGSRAAAEHMGDFEPQAVVNPDDRYGGYLVLALQRPVTFQLATWLMSPPGAELPQRRAELGAGRWIVCADGQFGLEVSADLRAAGCDVTLTDPRDGDPDVSAAVGFVAGAEQDTANLALAAHARRSNPSLFLCVRQRSHRNAPLLRAFDIDSVFVPTELVAREALARVVTPIYWSFLDHVLRQDDAWSAALVDRLVQRCGTAAPRSELVQVDARQAPAVTRWLGAQHQLLLGDLLRHPWDRDEALAAVPVALVRDGVCAFAPDLDVPLQVGDEVVIAGRSRAHDLMMATLFYDDAVEYVATGRRTASTWLWRRLSQGQRATDPAQSADGPARPVRRP